MKIKKYNIAIDVNTGYMKNLKTGGIDKKRIMPSIAILKMCQENDIPLVLGSDAHQHEKIADNFKQAKEVLRDLNIKSLYYFEKRKLVGYKI